MLDGRIDTQGTIKELRTLGILDDVAHDAEAEANGRPAVAVKEEVEIAPAAGGEDGEAPKDHKKPRKLIKDEHREEGGVKWAIYRSYLRASWVLSFCCKEAFAEM
jgi:hypothetical protein